MTPGVRDGREIIGNGERQRQRVLLEEGGDIGWRVLTQLTPRCEGERERREISMNSTAWCILMDKKCHFSAS